MSEGNSPISGAVVIVGGGVAGLEALLALRALAGDRVEVTLVSRDDAFVDRPVTVAEPFGQATAEQHSLPDIAADLGARFVQATVEAVAAAEHRISCADGASLCFDSLILAPGARLEAPSADGITFGTPGSVQAVKDMLTRLRAGGAQSVAFVAPSLTGWLLPLYELALMTARDLSRSKAEGVQLYVVTEENRPLIAFGKQASDSVGRLLANKGIEFVGATRATLREGAVGLGGARELAVDHVVTLPLVVGPGLAGVPTTQPDGFIPVDAHGRVEGLADVYAAGDAVEFPVKQGGLAAQQADAVAAHVAAHHGAAVDAPPFEPVLRGMLLTGGEPQFIRTPVSGAAPQVTSAWYPLWWPPTKIAGRYLAPYLLERSESEGEGFTAPHAGFIDLDIPLTAATLPG
jgi:sulfide:quinone oxidoreductase